MFLSVALHIACLLREQLCVNINAPPNFFSFVQCLQRKYNLLVVSLPACNLVSPAVPPKWKAIYGRGRGLGYWSEELQVRHRHTSLPHPVHHCEESLFLQAAERIQKEWMRNPGRVPARDEPKKTAKRIQQAADHGTPGAQKNGGGEQQRLMAGGGGEQQQMVEGGGGDSNLHENGRRGGDEQQKPDRPDKGDSGQNVWQLAAELKRGDGVRVWWTAEDLGTDDGKWFSGWVHENTPKIVTVLYEEDTDAEHLEYSEHTWCAICFLLTIRFFLYLPPSLQC